MEAILCFLSPQRAAVLSEATRRKIPQQSSKVILKSNFAINHCDKKVNDFF
jgi:hypothetical protein